MLTLNVPVLGQTRACKQDVQVKGDNFKDKVQKITNNPTMHRPMLSFNALKIWCSLQPCKGSMPGQICQGEGHNIKVT